jgi:hypothetical protein
MDHATQLRRKCGSLREDCGMGRQLGYIAKGLKERWTCELLFVNQIVGKCKYNVSLVGLEIM